MSRRLATLLAGALLAGAAQGAAPTVFPELGEDGVEDAFAVVTFAQGGELPPFPQCVEPGVTCMDPPPFWMATRVEAQVAGRLPERLEVATTSHHGMATYTRDPRPVFVWIRSDGRAYQLPRYAVAYVHRHADGRWVIPVTGELPGWLPCEAMARRVPIDTAELEPGMAVPRGSEHHAGAIDSGFYVDTPRGALPRYGIPVDALADLLPARGHRFREAACPG